MRWARNVRLGDWTVTLVDVHVTAKSLADEKRRRAVLSPQEAETYNALRFEKRRREWLAGRLAAKLALRRRLRASGGTAPPLARIGVSNRDGASGPPVSPIAGVVSISHSHGLAAAVAGPAPVGVDIERLRPFSASLRTVFLNDAERAWLGRAEAEQPELPTLGWAFKEAFCKARLIGIQDGLPGPEWRGWDDNGRLLWRWPQEAAPRKKDAIFANWQAHGRLIDDYAVVVVGASPKRKSERA
ncbi:4'-phosphopantetheinyl transferase superfamily protein [Methylocystis sp. Sn-Cys]|uniref:4'-phosphopantetheinyl transferase family protein n=1 Tax=Methylocystis sp. Sn-Cys TaxID=1701263 RepID=UPI00192063E9|nr:4'-phosphopantetheinyl transferase superfamily protein [Methylocystis sp. Sn-Cys]MBL1257773.1 4'-phosphopantetheinyl transferase superfamily protein [Methylocystis sp. Sn-Cys]